MILKKFKSNFKKELSDYPIDTKINFPKENLFSQPEVKIFLKMNLIFQTIFS